MMCFGTPAAAASPPAQRQQTLGEITLEEFLVRAGMVREDMAAGPTVPPVPAALPQPPQPPMLFPQSNAFAPNLLVGCPCCRSFFWAYVSSDGKYLLTGGEDDLVQLWSMDDRKIVAWGEGHNSWVSGVAFDSYWLPPNSDGTRDNVVYRFGSVGRERFEEEVLADRRKILQHDPSSSGKILFDA